MGGFQEGALACVPGLQARGRRSLHCPCGLAGLVVALAIHSFSTPGRALELTDPPVSPPPPSFPVQCLALENPGRGERSMIALDPVAARVVAGTWTMPVKDEMVTFPNGQVRRWQLVRATSEGTFAVAVRGSYLAVELSSEIERVFILEASGHSMVYCNGEPHVGDPYAHGYVRLPIQLRKGSNTLLFQAGRDRHVTARLHNPAAAAMLNSGDVTAPDLVVDEPVNAEAAIVVINASSLWSDGLTIVSHLAGGAPVLTSLPALPPLSVRKLGFRIQGPAPRESGSLVVKLSLQGRPGSSSEPHDTAPITLRVRQAGQARKRTFRSTFDGSVQYYALVPADPEPGKTDAPTKTPRRPGLVLTLHGAAVEAIGQAEAYAGKPGLHIVAPTNRRPYGFDWEDWGRLDAIEVLERAQQELQTDPRRTFLTGHSMGGHGAWHLGVTFPDRFAVVAPSAGWISMWSYAGARRSEKANPLEELALRAANPSDTLALVRNLGSRGVYILHGDADDNVPVSEARRMREILGTFHPDFVYHEQPGAGHWWGSPCVDWPPLFAFFGEHKLPVAEDVRRIDFVTMSPGVSARADWATIEAQDRCLAPSAVHLNFDRDHRRISGTTDNVARLALDLTHILSRGEGAITVELDSQGLKGISPASYEGSTRIWLIRKGATWLTSAKPPSLALKGPHRYGPLKEAFRNRFVLVYGTKGTAAENAWAFARARYDAELFWYRGNGSVELVADRTFLDPDRKAEFQDRNLVLYGNAESHAAWPVLLANSPVQVRRGRVQAGSRELTGNDLACLFVRPRPDSEKALVGVVAGTGLPGSRLTERLPYFLSGVAYPDCSIFRAHEAEIADVAIQAAGFFGTDWGLDSGEFIWKQ